MFKYLILLTLFAFPAHAQSPITIDADSVTYKMNENTIQFAGNVNLQQENRTLTAQNLIANMSEDGGLQTLVATGNVKVINDTDTATSNTATYILASETLTLEGNATLTRGQNTLTGETLTYNLANGTVNVTPKKGERIRANLQPSQ